MKSFIIVIEKFKLYSTVFVLYIGHYKLHFTQALFLKVSMTLISDLCIGVAGVLSK